MSAHLLFWSGNCHELAPDLEALGCESAGTRSRHRHPKEQIDLGVALCKAVIAEETK